MFWYERFREQRSSYHHLQVLILYKSTMESMVQEKCLPWWRHHMETFSALLALCVGNSAVTSEFLSQRPVTRSFDVFFYLRLNKHLSKQSRRRWFETPLHLSWRHCNNSIHHQYTVNGETIRLILHRCLTMSCMVIIQSLNSVKWIFEYTHL